MQLTLQQEESVMLSSAEEIQLLQNIVHAIGAKKTLDIGISFVSIRIVLPLIAVASQI